MNSRFDLSSSPLAPSSAPGGPFRTSAPSLARTVPVLALLLSVVCFSAPSSSGQSSADSGAQTGAAANSSGFGPLVADPPKGGLTPEQVIQKFGARETQFQEARNQYTFRESVKVQTISDETNKPDGTYQQVTDIVLTQDGHPAEHVVFAPQNTLERVVMSQSDFDDIAHRLPFILTTKDLPEYDLKYLGQQRVDDLDTYVFDCKPKVIEKNRRYFQGRIWVDQLQFEIVLITGKNVPDDLNPRHADLSPPFSTYYQEVDGENWFPVYTKGEGILHFPPVNGALSQDVHMRYVVRYEDYKRFQTKTRIIYNGEDLPPAPPGSQPPPSPGSGQPASPAGVSPTPTQPAPDPDAPVIKPKGKN